MKKRYKYPLLGLVLVLILGTGFGIWWLEVEYQWAFLDESIGQVVKRLDAPINERYNTIQSKAQNLPKRQDIPKHLIDNIETAKFDPPLVDDEKKEYNFTFDTVHSLNDGDRNKDLRYRMGEFQKISRSTKSLHYLHQKDKASPWFVRGRQGDYLAQESQKTLDCPYAFILRTVHFTRPQLFYDREVYSTGEYEIEVFLYDLRDGELKSFSVLTFEETIKPVVDEKRGIILSQEKIETRLGKTFHAQLVKKFKIELDPKPLIID